MERTKLIEAAKLLAEEIASDKPIQRLEKSGFSKRECLVLRDVVPEAFAIPVLEDLGISSIEENASARNLFNRWVSVSLSDIPIFIDALALAREHRAIGVLPPEVFQVVASSSALINTANQALNEGSSLEGGTVALTFLGSSVKDLRKAQ